MLSIPAPRLSDKNRVDRQLRDDDHSHRSLVEKRHVGLIRSDTASRACSNLTCPASSTSLRTEDVNLHIWGDETAASRRCGVPHTKKEMKSEGKARNIVSLFEHFNPSRTSDALVDAYFDANPHARKMLRCQRIPLVSTLSDKPSLQSLDLWNTSSNYE